MGEVTGDLKCGPGLMSCFLIHCRCSKLNTTMGEVMGDLNVLMGEVTGDLKCGPGLMSCFPIHCRCSKL